MQVDARGDRVVVENPHEVLYFRLRCRPGSRRSDEAIVRSVLRCGQIWRRGGRGSEIKLVVPGDVEIAIEIDADGGGICGDRSRRAVLAPLRVDRICLCEGSPVGIGKRKQENVHGVDHPSYGRGGGRHRSKCTARRVGIGRDDERGRTLVRPQQLVDEAQHCVGLRPFARMHARHDEDRRTTGAGAESDLQKRVAGRPHALRDRRVGQSDLVTNAGRPRGERGDLGLDLRGREVRHSAISAAASMAGPTLDTSLRSACGRPRRI